MTSHCDDYNIYVVGCEAYGAFVPAPGSPWLCVRDYPNLLEESYHYLSKEVRSIGQIFEDFLFFGIEVQPNIDLANLGWINREAGLLQCLRFPGEEPDRELIQQSVQKLLKLKGDRSLHIHSPNNLAPLLQYLVEDAEISTTLSYRNYDGAAVGLCCQDEERVKAHRQDFWGQLIDNLTEIQPEIVHLDLTTPSGELLAAACNYLDIPYSGLLPPGKPDSPYSHTAAELIHKSQNIGYRIMMICDTVLFVGNTVPYSFQEKEIRQLM